MPRPPATNADATRPPASVAAPHDVMDSLAAALDQLAALAHKDEPHDDDAFYRELLRIVAGCLSAEGGAVWRRDHDGRLRRRAVIETDASPLSDDQRASREALLQCALADDATQIVAPHSHNQHAANPTDGVVIATPVAESATSTTPTVVELILTAGHGPNVYDAAARFLESACEIASQRSLRHEVQRLRTDRDELTRLAELGRRVHGAADLTRTCLRIANDGRDAIGCDRLSVVTDGRLMAVSGADRVDRRTATARGIESLAEVATQLGEPLYWTDGQADDESLGPAAERLQQLADRSHARQLAAVPLLQPGDLDDAAPPQVVGVLVAEQFDASPDDLAKDRLAAAAEILAPALSNAIEWRQLPLARVARSFRTTATPSLRRKLLAATVAVTVAAAMLTFIQTDFTIESTGELQPAEQSVVFAPRSGLVDTVLIQHGDTVTAGQPLVSLRDPELDLAIKQLDGELATTRRQLDAVQAARTGRDAQNASPADAYRLSAEQQMLEGRLQSLRARQALLAEEKASLAVASPAAGSVVSWQIEQSLIGRPVERGQQLVTIADTTSDWRIELHTPDDRVGHLLAAQDTAEDQPLRVEYRLASQETGMSSGTVVQIAQRAEVDPDRPDTSTRYVRVVVTPDEPTTPVTADAQSIRPGQTVHARIHCGRRSLAYVWLHDVWHTIKTWWHF